jgi:cytosine/adenosine deaminase-related metal-dependent hydrolase
VSVQPTAFNFAVRIEQSAARTISVTVRENLDHGRRIIPQPPSLPAGWYCARRAWNGGFPAASAFAAPAAALRLPARGNIVIRNAYVMTMEPGAPDIKAGEVHVKDGVIVAVGQKLKAPGATIINGVGMIDIPVGLSVDTVELMGNADMFGIMKFIQNIENGKSENEFKLTARRVLELGTIEGARSMGIADKSRLAQGGQARRPHYGLDARRQSRRIRRSRAQLVTAAQPSNVDTVVVDGRILKRGGKLTALNTVQIVAEAAAANAALRKRANWW